MATENSESSIEVDLEKLEVRVQELIRACELLREENGSLRARQELLVAEKANLVERTELARSRIEAMISRLRSLEEAS